jgi:hypothetical protein
MIFTRNGLIPIRQFVEVESAVLELVPNVDIVVPLKLRIFFVFSTHRQLPDSMELGGPLGQ